MALPDLTGQNIENTYQRVLQTDGTNFYNGTGSAFITDTGGNQPDNNGIIRYTNGKLISDSNFSYNGTIFDAQCEEVNLVAASSGIRLQGSITMSGGISASGTIIAQDIVNASDSNSGLRIRPTVTDILNDLNVIGEFSGSIDGGTF
jgi:hypothetical protein